MRYLIILLTSTLFVYGLSIDEAIELGIKNSFKIEQGKVKVEIKRAQKEISKSSNYPSLDLAYGFETQNRDNSFGERESSYLALRSRYAIFSGYKDSSLQEASNIALLKEEENLNALKDDLALEVALSYIDIFRAKEQIKSEEESLELLKAQREDAKNFFELGITQKNELLKVEVELLNREYRLLDANSKLKIAQNRLENLILDTPKNLIEPNLIDSSYSFAPLLESALKNRAEIKRAKRDIEEQDFIIESKKSSYYPRVDMALEAATYGDNIGPFDRGVGYSDRVNLRLEASYNIFDGSSKKYSVEIGVLEKRAKQSALMELQSQIELQLKNELEYYNLNLKKLEVAKAAYKQAQESYKIQNDRYKNQIDTATDLLNAQESLSRARIDMSFAKYELYSSILRIKRVSGDIRG